MFVESALWSKSAGSFVPAESLSAGKAAWAVNRKVASLKASIKGRKYCLCPPNSQPLTELGCSRHISVSSYRVRFLGSNFFYPKIGSSLISIEKKIVGNNTYSDLKQ